MEKLSSTAKFKLYSGSIKTDENVLSNIGEATFTTPVKKDEL